MAAPASSSSRGSPRLNPLRGAHSGRVHPINGPPLAAVTDPVSPSKPLPPVAPRATASPRFVPAGAAEARPLGGTAAGAGSGAGAGAGAGTASSGGGGAGPRAGSAPVPAGGAGSLPHAVALRKFQTSRYIKPHVDPEQDARDRKRRVELTERYEHEHDPEMVPKSNVVYPYAVLLTNSVREKGLSPSQLRTFQLKLVEFLVRSGVSVAIMNDTSEGDSEGDTTPDHIVLLIKKLTRQQLSAEIKRNRVDVFLNSGRLEVSPDVDSLTVAEQALLTHRVIERAMDRVRDNAKLFRGVVDNRVEHGEAPPLWTDVVTSSGLLHDKEFNNKFFGMFTSWRRICRLDNDDLLCIMRDKFGERVAFYFYFLDYYNKWLVPLAVGMLLYYVCFRFVDWGMYQRGLAVLGFLVPVVWCRLLSIFWKRKSAGLCYKWRIHNAPDGVLPNPHNPDYKFVINPVTNDHERRYDPKNNRLRLKVFVPIFTVVNFLVLTLVTTPFIQWYVFSKLAPVCSCCDWYNGATRHANQTRLLDWSTLPGEECHEFFAEAQQAQLDAYAEGRDDPAPTKSCTYFLTCFNAPGSTLGTDRWLFILFQGILLGILLDVVQFNFFAWVTEQFTKFESWPTEREYEQRVIRKQYIFIWFNMFFWFLFIAFVYVPFGEHLQTFLINIGFGWTVPGFGWRTGVINIDEAFVTPLIVTQALNLTLETLIPYIVNKKARALERQQRSLLHNMREAAAKTAKAATEATAAVKGAADKVGDVAAGVAHGVADKVGDVAAGVADKVGGVADKVGDVAHGVADKVRHNSAGNKHEAKADASGDASAADAAGAAGASRGKAVVAQAHSEEEAKTDVTVHVKPVPRSKTPMQEFLTSRSVEPVGDQLYTPVQLRKVALSEFTKNKDVDHAAASLWMKRLALVDNSHRTAEEELVDPSDCGDTNHYDAFTVIQQLQKEPFHPRIDYLDVFMQLGYVTQFTNAWSLAPLPATINNVLELRGDVLKMFHGFRRPVPVRERGILEWEKVLEKAVFLGTLTTIGLIVVGTGQLEYWIRPSCFEDPDGTGHQYHLDTIMGPDLECLPSWGWRLAAGVVLFFTSMFLQGQLLSCISGQERDLEDLIRGENVLQARKAQERLLPSLPEDFLRHFRIVFDRFAHNARPDPPPGLSEEELEALEEEYNAMETVLSSIQCAQMFTELNRLGMETMEKGTIRVLELSDHEALFEILDADDSQSISFAEAALAISRCQADPFLKDAVGFNLAGATSILAEQFKREDVAAGKLSPSALASRRRLTGSNRGSHA